MNAASIIDTAWHPLATGCPPDWASGWGQDRYGVFVEFTLQEITQRLRWIPPGRFWMGSPEEEPGRYDNEGPRHRVTFSQGFWLFDTPCTRMAQVMFDRDRRMVVVSARPSVIAESHGAAYPPQERRA